MKSKITIFSILFFLFLTQCDLSKNIEEDAAFKFTDYPNVLNYEGIPKHKTDRSVFMFSDLGAWHGYALPDSAGFEGSFVGPFLMTQDNGVWISECLSKLEVIDLETGEKIDFKPIIGTGKKAYSGNLEQVFTGINHDIIIHTHLWFLTNRTAQISISLSNENLGKPITIQAKWLGNHFLEGMNFSKNNNKIKIGFSKNENIGMISMDNDKVEKFEVQENSYEITCQPLRLVGEDDWHFNLFHTFCFNEMEWKQEQKAIDFERKNNDAYHKMWQRWDNQLNSILDKVDEKYTAKEYEQIAIKCLQTLNNNWRSAAGFLKHDGLFPSYNYEWFHGFWSWDSWKHAVAIAHYDTELAKNQIRAMYDFQDEMGMIADCVYRDTIIENHNWRDTKPPLSAWAIWKVYEQSNDKAFLEEMYPKVKKYHDWWYKYRDNDQNGLCEYGSTDGSLVAAKWESGMDNAVRFDDTKMVQNNEFAWSMNRESVDLNAYLFAEKKFLSKIAKVLKKVSDSNRYNEQAALLKLQIQMTFYDEQTGWFYDIDLETKKQLKAYGAEGWIPLWANAATKEQAQKAMQIMTDSTKFATYIPFPTLSANHPEFDANKSYWRGPVWIDQAYFAINGLRNCGFEEEATMFTNQLFNNLEGLKNSNQPIRENYNPLTGEGFSSNHFSWSAACLMLLMIEE